MQREDFFSAYLKYCEGTEVPVIADRWSAIGSIGAALGKSVWIPFGKGKIYPNLYCMLIGTSGSRKSTAIKNFKALMYKMGYKNIAASKTTKEKFLLDLSGIESSKDDSDFTEENLFGPALELAESFIMADEFNDFFGNNNIEFISLLGSLWDIDEPYESRIKNGKSFKINNLVINILGGNTPTGFSQAFPPEILGQGFFSRMLLIHCEAKGIRITFPRIPSDIETAEIISLFEKIRTTWLGKMELTTGASGFLDKIYKQYPGVNDVRFESYANRRFTQLIKLSIIHALAAYKVSVDEEAVLYANTVLSYAEHFMPKALGEFGKAKNSDITHKIISVLDNTSVPLKIKDLWKHVSNDLEKMTDLGAILNNLVGADKIISTPTGFLSRKIVLDESVSDVVDYRLLTNEERKLI